MPLKSYFQIHKGELSPRYLISHRIPGGIDSNAAGILALDDLFKIHNKLVQPFNENPNPEIPGYSPSDEISLLELKAIIARKMLDKCSICENRCHVNRNEGKRGKCRVGAKSMYVSEFLHFGEEPELVPSHTVFFTGCTFECIFCQNWDIAHGDAAESDAGFRADINLAMKIVEKANYAKNLNLVGGNPDQHIASILELLILLASFKYKRPIVWNSNLYMTPEALMLLSGVADVHLADFKYGSNECGREYSGVKNYWDFITRNLLAVNSVSDILIRHLVLPGHVECCTSNITKWVAENLPDAQFNLMFQYRPEYKALNHPVIGRYLTESEKSLARKLASDAGLI